MAQRTHLVMVPGFGGFDVLGQLAYYTGLTDVIAAWKQRSGRTAVMHYFDNLPTAAVTTRAKKLRAYLDKLVTRDVIQRDDRIVLVGHSTGGLDIRQLVVDLHGSRAATGAELLRRIERLAFLSVPQRGTNIADWVREHRTTAGWIISLLRRAVGLHVPISFKPIQLGLGFLDIGSPEILEAVEDANRELHLPLAADALALADARRASAEIDLWLANTDGDFMAIDDLASARASGRRPVDDGQGEVERAIWAEHGITTRSYATIARCPYDRADMQRRSGEQRSLANIVEAARAQVLNTDAIFRIAYAACAGGPFRSTPITARWLPGCAPPGAEAGYAPEPWENDGIVNTASMMWPDGAETRLVSGDHADIIGHYRLVPKDPEPAFGRLHDAYDLLGSDSTFDHARLAAVWHDLLDFAA